MSSLLDEIVLPFRRLYDHRRLIFQTVTNDIRQKHAGSVVGAGWFLITPILFLVLYAIVYIYIYRLNFEGITTPQYVLYIFCGVFTLQMFAEGLSVGAVSLIQNKSLLTNAVFPAEMIVVRSVLASQLPGFLSLLLAILLSTVLGLASLSMIVAPLVLLLMILFLIGVGFLLASFSLIMRDIPEFLKFFNMVLLIISPIGFFVKDVPEVLRAIVLMNPLAYFMTCVQDALVFKSWPSAAVLVGLVVISVGMFCLGHAFMLRVKSVLSDYAT